jgi:hypothetical protein
VTPATASVVGHDPLIDTVRFFSTLYAGQSGILELRTVPLEQTPEHRRAAWRLRDFVPVMQGHFDVQRIDRFIKETTSRRMAAYYGVALRTPQAAADRKGSAPYCQTLTALFVDADFKHLGELETRKRLSDFPIPPSVIVNSGGGLHPYWLLRQPLDLQRDYGGAQSILRRLAKGVAEIVDESVSEPARILRIPGGLNFKKEYGEPRLVVVEP